MTPANSNKDPSRGGQPVIQLTRLQLFLSVAALCISVGASVGKGATSMLDARYERRIDEKIGAQLATATTGFATRAEVEADRGARRAERAADQERWNDVQLRMARIEASLDRLTNFLLEGKRGSR